MSALIRSRAAAVAAAAVLAAGPAYADRVVLIAPPAALARAAHDQLAPYHIDVVVADAAPPSGADGARAIAGRYGARAVAWVQGGALVVFDAVDGETAERPAPAPLDDASAAALALTLKTVLRERWSIEDAATPAPVVIDLAVTAGLRMHGGAAEPRVGLGVDYRLDDWPILVGLRGGLGGGVPAHADTFSGTWNDRTLGAIALYPWISGPFEVRTGGGASLKWTAIHGVLLPSGGAAEDSTLALGLDGEVDALWRRPPIAIGLRAATTWVPWRQVYTVADQPVFEMSHVEGELDLLVIFAL
jgi:hypothetical protein